MKDKIMIDKANDKLNFYLIGGKGKFFLFTQAFTKGVYDFFKDGKAESEIKSFKKWKHNPRLDKTIEKIPLYITYVRKNVIYA